MCPTAVAAQISRAGTWARPYNRAMHAGSAYLFRHALLRDAAYELQLPVDRARLHELAIHLIEQAFGGRAPEPPEIDSEDYARCAPHPVDPVAHELAVHAQLANETNPKPELQAAYCRYLRRAAEYAQAKYHNDEAFRLYLLLADQYRGVSRFVILRGAGAMAHNVGMHDRAATAFRLALQTAREMGDIRREGMVLYNIALAEVSAGRYEIAQATCESALIKVREAGSRRDESTVMGGLAAILQESGKFDAAEVAYREALQLFDEVDNKREQGVALGNVAILYSMAGRREEAQHAFERALVIHREIREPVSEGITLGTMAVACLNAECPDKALATLDEALAILRRCRARNWEGIMLGYRASVLHECGRHAEADLVFRNAIAIHRESRQPRYEGTLGCSHGLCLLALGAIEGARETWRSGASILGQINDTVELNVKISEMREACAKAGVPPFDGDDA